MKIIQLQRPALIDHLLEKTAIIICSILMLLLIVSVVVWSGDIYDVKIYDTADEVITLFYENRAEFEAVLPTLYNQELRGYLWDEYGIEDWNDRTLDILKRKSIISEQQYTTMRDFFVKYGIPYITSKGYKEFMFYTRNNDVMLYHIDVGEYNKISLMLYLKKYGEVNHLFDNWYCTISDCDFTREISN